MKEIDLTKGTIFKKLILFALPMILGNLLQQIYNIVDTLIVGRFVGNDALASVGSAYSLMIFLTSIIIGLCMGSGAYFSEDYGKKNFNELKEDIWHSFWFIFTITILIILIIYPLTDVLLIVLQTPEELFEMMRSYLLIIFAGLPFVFLYNFFAYLQRSVGRTVSPLVFLAISSLINVGLDFAFVLGFNMGVSGAAIATVIAQVISGIGLMIYSFINLSILKEKTIKIKFNSSRLKQIIKNDFSTCIQQSVMNFGILMIQGLVNSFGKVIMAAFAAAVKIDTLAYMPAQEFANSYSLFVSQNFGAKERDRIKEGTKKAMITSVAFCFIISIIIVFAADNLMMLFVKSTEIETIKEGAKYLRIEGSMYIGIGILFLWYGYFRGINKPLISLILTIVSLGLRVLLSYSFAKTTPLGVIAIWCSIPIGWFIADITGLVLYKKYSKKALENI